MRHRPTVLFVMLGCILAVTLLHTERIFATTAQTDLSIRIDGPGRTVVAGDQAHYTLQATNQGALQAVGVQAAVTLPDTVSLSASSPQASCTRESQLLTCELGVIGPKASSAITFTVDVAPEARKPFEVQGEVRSYLADPDGANNQATVITLVQPDVDLQLEYASPARPTAIAGEPFAFGLRLGNTGRSAARGALLQITLPADKIKQIRPSSPDTSCLSQTSTLICSIGIVAPAGLERPDWLTSGTVITFEVQPTSSLLVTDTVAILTSLSSEDPETTTSNNIVSHTFSVSRSSDLGVHTEHDQETVRAGTLRPYVFTISNAGPSDRSDVALNVEFPAALFSIEKIADPDCALETGQVVCQIGSLPANSSVSITLWSRIHTFQIDTVLLVAGVSGEGSEPDTGASNRIVQTIQVIPNILWLPRIVR